MLFPASKADNFSILKVWIVLGKSTYKNRWYQPPGLYHLLRNEVSARELKRRETRDKNYLIMVRFWNK